MSFTGLAVSCTKNKRTMNDSIKILQNTNQYVRQFSRAVLDYELFIFKERQ
jgi:hypothetical protein